MLKKLLFMNNSTCQSNPEESCMTEGWIHTCCPCSRSLCKVMHHKLTCLSHRFVSMIWLTSSWEPRRNGNEDMYAKENPINMHILKVKQEAHVTVNHSVHYWGLFMCCLQGQTVSPKRVLSKAHLSPPCLQHNKHDRRLQHSLNFYSNDLFVKLEQRN